MTSVISIKMTKIIRPNQISIFRPLKMWKLSIFVSVLVPALAAPKTGMIYNGDDAAKDEWQWMVAIYRNGAYRCGGVLIDPLYVLTAAHCVDRSGDYTVVLGDHDRDDDNGDEQHLDVDEITLHPNYDDIFLSDDIAMLLLNATADTNRTNIHALNQFSNSTIDERIRKEKRKIDCFVTGWGYETDSKGYWRLAPVLQELSVSIVGEGTCAKFMLGNTGKTNLCYKAKNAATCSGDSGSPITCLVDGAWYLAALHSFRLNLDGCRGGTKAGVRVSLYTDWIASLMM